MQTFIVRAVLPVVLALVPLYLHSQSNEFAATVGVAFSPDAKGFLTCGEAVPCTIPPGTIGSVSVGPGFSWQATFGHRLANFKAAALYVEAPLAGSPSRNGPGFLASEFSSIFFTPSAHIKFLPSAGISPFASVGGGLAHFHQTSGSSSDNTWAIQVGGGVDVKTPLRALAVRAELRDFITGRPGNVIALGGITSSHLHHLFANGGVVIKF